MRGISQSRIKFIIKFIVISVIILTISVAGIVIINKTKLLDRVNSVEKIRSLVEMGGVYSSLIFVILQILQTTILQFPSAVVTMAGVVALGAGKAFVLSFVSIMLGSIIMFIIGRKVGKRFLRLFLGEDKTNKLVDLISNGKYAFFVMMMFPFFPDDLLCAVAGVGDMSFRYFFLTIFITRLIGVAGCVFFSDSILSVNKTTLPIWIILGVIALVVIIFVIKNKNKIDKKFLGISQK